MLDINRLAIVLKHANTSPPVGARDAFYALKQAICERYGKLIGEDLQAIEKTCWGDHYYGGCHDDCQKCGGTGVYQRFYVRLERWQVGGQIFHRPLPRQSFTGGRRVTIRGRIVHRPSKLAFACWRVLELVFNPTFALYLDQFRGDERQLRRQKAVLAYLCGFSRSKWQVKAIRFHELERAAALVPE